MTDATGASPTEGLLGCAVVTLDKVTVRFPRRPEPVLRGVSLSLAPGEHVLVLGASGSGKSTLLHVITGVVPHTVAAGVDGKVGVGETATSRTPVVERARHLGVLAQDPGSAVCLPGVEQELALPLENQGAVPAEIGPRITRALAAAGADDLRGRATATLSGGESQRVALAAALVAEPDVLLLDEPSSMLDPAGIASLRRSLGDALERYDPAVVLVEHRLDEWAGASGTAGLPARTIALDETGEVIADGPTASVLRNHAHELHAAGCWLPLDAELFALTGAEGGLAAGPNVALLGSLADEAPVQNTGSHGPSGLGKPAPAPALAASALTVGRTQPRARRRRGHSPGTVPVLAGVDLAVAPGEVVALLGANGVGKTTLLLTLAGLLAPLAGQVEGARPGLVFQNPEHQFLANTVRGEIAHGLPASRAEEVVSKQLRHHRLEHLADQNPFRLSGGEKRRLSLAAMLAHHRPVLLADEPTLGLDRRDSIATAAILRQAAEEGTAIVLSAHDLRMVATVADRVVLLGDDGVLADGPTVDVLAAKDLLALAGLTLPPLVAWLIEQVPNSAVAHVLRELDSAVSAPNRPRADTSR